MSRLLPALLLFASVPAADVCEAPLDPGGLAASDQLGYAVAADGQSFVLLQEERDATAIHDHVNIVLGWDEALRAIHGGP